MCDIFQRPGKQVAGNFHQLYPKSQPQLPKKMVHQVFQGGYIVGCFFFFNVHERLEGGPFFSRFLFLDSAKFRPSPCKWIAFLIPVFLRSLRKWQCYFNWAKGWVTRTIINRNQSIYKVYNSPKWATKNYLQNCSTTIIGTYHVVSPPSKCDQLLLIFLRHLYPSKNVSTS